jgi:hypothetical protein
MRASGWYASLALVVAMTAAAQEPIFVPDDFVDPALHDGKLVIIRLTTGAVGGLVDDFRPLDRDAAFVHLASSFYWSDFQLAYKRSEVRVSSDAPPVSQCDCTPPIYFPTPPPEGALPEAPRPGSKDTVQFAWYHSALRYRLSWSFQPIHTNIVSFATQQQLSRVSGDEQSFALDADTHVRVRGINLWGSLVLVRTVRSGTIDNRTQNELLYTSRFPGRALGPVLLRTALTLGAITGRGASGLNVVSPEVELFWHERTTRANLHVVWNLQSLRSGAIGWKTNHQIAVFVDHSVYVKLFPRKPRGE